MLNEYCHTVDRGTAREVSDLFSPDALLKPYFDDKYDVIGRSEIERWYAHYMENFRGNIRHLKHMIVSPVITVEASTVITGETIMCFKCLMFPLKFSM